MIFKTILVFFFFNVDAIVLHTQNTIKKCNNKLVVFPMQRFAVIWICTALQMYKNY